MSEGGPERDEDAAVATAQATQDATAQTSPVAPKSLFAQASVTRAIIIANIVVFVAQVIVVQSAAALLAMPDRAMLLFGANYTPFTIAEYRVATLLTSCFLHFSVLHIGFNMYALRNVGPFVERIAGAARFASMYFVSGIVGSAASALFGWLSGADRLSAGASGAICGVIGAALVLGIRIEGWRGPIARSMGFWLVMTIALGFKIHSDNAAHVGGALTGALMAATWRKGVAYGHEATRLIVGACAAITVLAFGAVIARDYFDPYATLTGDERLREAARAIDRDQCSDARRAFAGATRLSKNVEGLRRVKSELVYRCGGP